MFDPHAKAIAALNPAGDVETPLHYAKAIAALRLAGNVERCHTTPHHGSYSVGLHTFNMLGMLLKLHPRPSVRLIAAVTYHDVGEGFLGDLPYHAKERYPALREAYEEAEEAETKASGLATVSLSADEILWLRWLDLTEFWMWALEQRELGNRRFEAHIEECLRIITMRWDTIPEPVKALINDWSTGEIGHG
jgi:hypothetical protein